MQKALSGQVVPSPVVGYASTRWESEYVLRELASIGQVAIEAKHKGGI